MTPTQTTPPASPASLVPTAGPTKEAMQQNDGPCQATPREVLYRQLMDCNIPKNEREHYAARCLKEAEAVVQAAESAFNVWDRRSHEHLCYPNTYGPEIEAMYTLCQSLTAYARAAGKGEA